MRTYSEESKEQFSSGVVGVGIQWYPIVSDTIGAPVNTGVGVGVYVYIHPTPGHPFGIRIPLILGVFHWIRTNCYKLLNMQCPSPDLDTQSAPFDGIGTDQRTAEQVGCAFCDWLSVIETGMQLDFSRIAALESNCGGNE
jgi:hypothetical protein